MDDSFIARLGYDPVAIYTRIYGHPPAPGGIVRLSPRETPAETETEARPPGVEPAPQSLAAPPPDENRLAPSPDDPPPEAPEPDPPPPGEEDHPPGGGGAPSFDPDPDPAPPQPETGRPPETLRTMRAWLDAHWATVEAMALAGEAPQWPAPPPPPPKPGSTSPPPPVHVRKGDRWTKPRMAEFLRQLAATHSVSAAASAVGMHRRSAYKLRARLKGQPFDIAWEAAFRHGYDNLAHSALELALEGEEVPHYYQGELMGTHRKRNPQLILQLLKMRNRAGAPMLGRYGAAAEWWGDRWDLLLERVETGAVDWSDERAAIGEAGLAKLELPDAEREADRLIARNAPDEPSAGRREP